ncbi:MAG: hypothetical protein IV086_01965 [Hyphomonadaceae bacterium]|nr:MAG: Uncharacterized protein FD160_1089 [Caulobacteraceae bacterium]MBT9444446.1 hypothetical protein [Hyphomonadaceae bacterium]
MQIDQLLRRLFWRVRRQLRPSADNDPIVWVEAPVAESRPGLSTGRLRPTVIAFVATLSVLAAGYAFLVAANSQAPLDTNRPAAADGGGSHAAAAASALLAPVAEDAASGAEEIPLLPNGRRLRGERIAAGTREAATAFVKVAATLGGDDPAVRDASDALAAGDIAAGRDALVRFNTRIAAGRVRLGSGATFISAVAAAAAVACEAEEAALREAARANSGGMVGPGAQAQFSHGRGVAFGWLMLLRGALADFPEIAEATVVEAAIPLDALAAAAERQPLFLFNGGDRAPWAPAHLEDQAAEFARAAAGARALALAARKPAVAAP